MISNKIIEQKRTRYRMLYRLEAWLETPMFILALVWLWLFGVEIFKGLTVFQERLVLIIWILFIVEFLLKIFLAEKKLKYLKKNWLTTIALVIPAFRAFRLIRALNILKTARVASTTRFVRALTSTNRFLTDVKEVQGPKPSPEMNVGMILNFSSTANIEELQRFILQLSQDVKEELESASGIQWIFHFSGAIALETDKPHMPSDFLNEASRHMTEGPYDLMLVFTDVALTSNKKKSEAGLASSVTRIITISTRKLILTKRGSPELKLNADAVRWNAAALLLHLIGHISGLHHTEKRKSSVMAAYEFYNERSSLIRFNEKERELLQKRAKRLPERELHGGNVLASFVFHMLMAFRHPRDVIIPLLKNGALLLPLSLPGLATAAVAPSILLVFTAEIWDVGINMANQTAIIYAVVSVVAASFYLVMVQSLLLPRKEKQILTEHLAVANVVIFLSILLACIGLFMLLQVLMLVIEIYIFPEGLMQTWPTLDRPKITFQDQYRLAAFISTIGVTTGALAGGLESQAIIKHLALFKGKP